MWKPGFKKDFSYTPQQKEQVARMTRDRMLQQYQLDRAEFEKEREQERIREERISAQKKMNRQERSEQEKRTALSATVSALIAHTDNTNKLQEYDALPLEYEKHLARLNDIVKQIEETPEEDIEKMTRLFSEMIEIRDIVSTISEKMKAATDNLRIGVELVKGSKAANRRAEIASNLAGNGRTTRKYKRKRKTRRSKR